MTLRVVRTVGLASQTDARAETIAAPSGQVLAWAAFPKSAGFFARASPHASAELRVDAIYPASTGGDPKGLRPGAQAGLAQAGCGTSWIGPNRRDASIRRERCAGFQLHS
jgi:hypothetical protein